MTSMLEVPVGGYLRVVAVIVRYRDQSVRPRLRARYLESHDMKFVPFALVLAIPLSAFAANPIKHSWTCEDRK